MKNAILLPMALTLGLAVKHEGKIDANMREIFHFVFSVLVVIGGYVLASLKTTEAHTASTIATMVIGLYLGSKGKDKEKGE